jgi:flagellar basal-body rod modification protein FlgD
MPTNPVGTVDTTAYVRDTSKDASNSKVDTETFLKLLVAQLKYQDPLEPQKDTAFVTQMAQMSSLQEIQAMNATLKNSQAYNMVGMEIYAEVLDKKTGEMKAYLGVVESVVIRGGIPYVVVGNAAININDIKQVFPPPPAAQPEPEEPEETGDSGAVEEPEAVEETEAAEEPGTVEGTQTGGETEAAGAAADG